MSESVNAEQPPPVPNERPAVWDAVIADMQARDQLGRHRYGTPLQPFNNRDALRDAYEEALDLAVYLKQALIEVEIIRSLPLDLLARLATVATQSKDVAS